MSVQTKEKEKKRKDYAFRRQFNEKPSIIPGCPGSADHSCTFCEAQVLVDKTPQTDQRVCTKSVPETSSSEL